MWGEGYKETQWNKKKKMAMEIMVTEKKVNKIMIWNIERNELQKKFC